MAYTFSMIKLEEAMQKSGCPICRRGHDAAIRWIETFLWEYVNDNGVRKQFYHSCGLCTQHTRALVAVEMSTSGPVLGVNILYRGLAQKTSKELQAIKKPEKNLSFFQEFLNEFRNPLPPLAEPKLGCEACANAKTAEASALHTFFESLNVQDAQFIKAYTASSGICLNHLRKGLASFNKEFPYASNFLIEHTIQFLEEQQVLISAFLKKNDYAHLTEPLTPDEQLAWRKVLTFFTGLPDEKFNHHLEPF